MIDNIFNGNDNNYNLYNNNNKIKLDNLNLDDLPGIFSDASEDKNKSNSDINQDNNNNNYEYLLTNEEIIPYTPEMSEEPIHPNKTKKLITDNIINKKREKYEEDIFTFKNINQKTNNFNFNSNDDIYEDNKNEIKNEKSLNNYNTIDEKNHEDNDQNIKASILNFEDIITKENNELLNKSKSTFILKDNINNFNGDIKNNNVKKTNTTKKLNVNKKKSPINFGGKKKKNNPQNIIKNNNSKNVNKSQKNANKNLKIFEHNNTLDGIEFENFMKEKNIVISTNENTTNKKKSIKSNKEKINDFLMRNTPKKKDNLDFSTKIKKVKINANERKNNLRKNPKLRDVTSLINKTDISLDKIINNNKSYKKERLNISKDKTPNKNNYNKSFLMDKENSIISSKSQIIKRKRPNTLRDCKKIEDTKVPLEVTKAEMDLALKNKKFGKNIQKRFSKINNDIIKFDNSKFIKYDTDQIRYGLIRDYSNIHPEKEDGFLQRMQFESLKRKNQDIKINELLEKSKQKYKMKEAQREKAFDRLIDDANRRLILKQEIVENEKYLMDYKDLMDANEKKYNREEWNDIYKKRFKDYEEYKKKKIDIQRQNEKIKKMLKEEEEINMCQMKKIPERKIMENTQRLYDDAKKRDFIKNQNMNAVNSVKNYKIPKKNDIYLSSFDDEEDASKYMKDFRSQAYSFIGDRDNNMLYKNNNNYRNFNNYNNNGQKNYFDNNNYRNNNYINKKNNVNNDNKSFDKVLKKCNKMSVTEFNNIRFDTRNNLQRKAKKKVQNLNINNYIFNDSKDFSNNNKNEIATYFDYKKSKQNGFSTKQNNNISSAFPYGYNYNNYNIYNINNLNNNINNINNSNSNDGDNDIDNYNLTNIAEQLMITAAMNKISNNKKKDLNNLCLSNNGLKNNNDYFNLNFNNNNYDISNEKKNMIVNRYLSECSERGNQNYEFDYNPKTEANQIVNQFMINQFEY